MKKAGFLPLIIAAALAAGCVTTATHEATKAELGQARSAAIKVAQSFADYKKETAKEAERLQQQAAASAAEAATVRQERDKAATELEAARSEANRIKQESSAEVEAVRQERTRVAAELQASREEGARVAAELEMTRGKLAVVEQVPPAKVNVAMTLTAPPELTDKLRRLEEEAAMGLEERKRLEQKAAELEQQLRAREGAEAVVSSGHQEQPIRITILERLLFESGETDLKPAACKVFKQFGEKLKQVTDKQIRVEGHTDNKPPRTRLRVRYPSNWELSSARATSVVRCLIKEGGLPPAMLSAVGYGDSRPVAGNDTEEGRRKNRRVEIVLHPRVPAEGGSQPVP